MSPPENIQLKLSKYIEAKRDKVFHAWVNPNMMKKWYAPGNLITTIAESDPKPGGAYKVQMKNEKGETFTTYGFYKELIQNEKLVFSWGWEGSNREEAQVTVEFFDKDGGTEILLTHERFTDQANADHHTEGWKGCLENLATRINSF